MSRIQDPNALYIIKTLAQNGYEAYFVGGCVRDMLLQKKVADLDITTSAHPKQIEKLFPVTLGVGAQFGVMIVVMGGVNYEVATFRNDGAYIDGRRPVSVEFSTAKEDVLRRDFTINGILYEPFEDKIIDYVNGQQDIKDKCLRAIGNPHHRFAEDKLRMLRAVRFTIRLQFQLELETKNAIQAMANEIVQVSKERITDETEKIITGLAPHSALELLRETNLLFNLLPHFKSYDATTFKNILSLFKSLEGCDFDTALAILLAHEGNNNQISIFHFPSNENPKALEHQLKSSKLFILPNQTLKNISHIWANLTLFKNYVNNRLALQIRVLLNPMFLKALKLLQKWETIYEIKTPLTPQLQKDFENLKHQKIPESLLNGTEILALGCPPGNTIATLKTELENLQLEDQIKTKDEAITFVQKNLSKQ